MNFKEGVIQRVDQPWTVEETEARRDGENIRGVIVHEGA